MRYLLLPLLLVVLLNSCGSEAPAEETGQAVPEEKVTTDPTQCFLFTQEGEPIVIEGDTVQRMIDSIKLQFLVKGPVVDGTLDFLPAEKDSRRGTFDGNLLGGGTIEAFYEYTQEGETERVGLIIQLKGETAEVMLTELEENGTTVSSHAIEAAQQLMRVDCQ